MLLPNTPAATAKHPQPTPQSMQHYFIFEGHLSIQNTVQLK